MTKSAAAVAMPAAKTPSPQLGLKGRTAVVTGSTSGIGLGIARALAVEGASFVLNGLGPAEDIERTRASLAAETGSKIIYCGADISKPAAIEDMIGAAVKSFGQVDILVNNAGIQHVAPIESFPPEKWDAIIGLNLSAAFHAIRAVFAGMKKRKWGRVVNIASAHGLTASPFKSAYVAAKHGLVGLTKVVALKGAEHGVTCNAICPGYVYTPLVEKQIEDQAKSHGISRERVIREIMLERQPNKQFATVEEMGALTAFLCGENARSITGTTLSVDGGWTTL